MPSFDSPQFLVLVAAFMVAFLAATVALRWRRGARERRATADREREARDSVERRAKGGPWDR